jgi:manganese-dependent inorganic pyrophosphatase
VANQERIASTIYVTGHVNPDTDSIAAAMGYAWLLRERDGLDAVAARAGAINPQTAWALKYLALPADRRLAALRIGSAPL